MWEALEVTPLASEAGGSDTVELQQLLQSMRRLRVVVLIVNMLCFLIFVALITAFVVIYGRYRSIKKERAKIKDEKTSKRDTLSRI